MTQERGDASALRAQRREEEHGQRSQDITAEDGGQKPAAAECPEAEEERRGSRPESAIVVRHH